MFDEIPISTMKLPRDDFKRTLTYPCPRSLDESRTALRIKHLQKEQALTYRMSSEVKTP